MLTFNVLLSVFLYANTVRAASSGFRISTSAAGYVATSATSMGDVVSTNDNNMYTVNITLGGEAFIVQLDTGSSDLWLNTTGRNVQFTNTTDLNITESYGKGSASGWLSFADMTIGDFSVPNQAFVNAVEIKDMPSTFDGILGMAFDTAVIYPVVQENWGTEAADALARSPITNLFALDPTTPNFFDVQLARVSPDPNNVAEGVFLISEHDDAFQNITSAPMLPSLTPQHWSLAMDGLTVDGTPFAFNASRVPGVPTGKVAAVLDTGFSLPQMPIAAVNAIYESLPGALYDPEVGWVVPCDAAPTVVFTFGGQDIPVHPLDLTFTQVLAFPSGNFTGCFGSFQALTLDPTEFVGFDLILGDSFLRNVYASYNYGNYQPNTTFDGQGPFVQLLPTTDASTMQAEFVANRTAALALLPPASDPATLAKLDASSSASSPDASSASAAGALDESASSASGSTDSWGKKYGTIALALLGANLAVGLVLLGLTLTMCMRSQSQGAPGRYAPVGARPLQMQQGDEEERAHLRYND
ncbi:aspartic peptidase domain-containing protein [Epithele typhae]|uniref:aspartic peptidase domain-containing protein n=1 Tax=Epithele typhae TaxID=378194 RepID=UPI002007A990|nr:aspartic peptidase domain-containing protein [Epithele typhae]KAH9912981.1 aspartic peptidase domain-containing protein [Epithele typhae]